MAYGAVEIVADDILQTPIVQEVPKTTPQEPLTRPQLIEAVTMIMDDIITLKCKAYKSEAEIPNKSLFHAKTLPSISLANYIARFSQYTKCQDDAIIYAMIYLDRIGEKNPEFSLDTFNVHK